MSFLKIIVNNKETIINTAEIKSVEYDFYDVIICCKDKTYKIEGTKDMHEEFERIKKELKV